MHGLLVTNWLINRSITAHLFFKFNFWKPTTFFFIIILSFIINNIIKLTLIINAKCIYFTLKFNQNIINICMQKMGQYAELKRVIIFIVNCITVYTY